LEDQFSHHNLGIMLIEKNVFENERENKHGYENERENKEKHQG